MRGLRNSAKAIIIQDGKLLCTKNRDAWGDFYLLPGGGQEPFETLHEALRRECREEIGAEIEIGDLRYIREYIGKNHEFAEWDGDLHQIEFMYECALRPGAMPQNGAVPDSYQTGIAWLALNEFGKVRLYPQALKKLLMEDGVLLGPVYLGDAG
ncbi:8-oxo-dGTP pyrophosphatase MutT (NUDIX family) [Hydrogenispora ethanolica]|uniref:8-oxo-dGTP pyrophosphatase MutT (NUDIX family) n=1 Tax=Hydrogenispora ethanolica TaxID=1082276 RepID=A0A4V6NGT1_HYDET|nr:NUDIX domain-containing protein [Hydrogenispora ethanolica]TCL62757.1 8-oxo-dGTP pyrophosphatase MutT (NUDIX family) [Hydrogenispora ethanolica]